MSSSWQTFSVESESKYFKLMHHAVCCNFSTQVIAVKASIDSPHTNGYGWVLINTYIYKRGDRKRFAHGPYLKTPAHDKSIIL